MISNNQASNINKISHATAKWKISMCNHIEITRKETIPVYLVNLISLEGYHASLGVAFLTFCSYFKILFKSNSNFSAFYHPQPVFKSSQSTKDADCLGLSSLHHVGIPCCFFLHKRQSKHLCSSKNKLPNIHLLQWNQFTQTPKHICKTTLFTHEEKKNHTEIVLPMYTWMISPQTVYTMHTMPNNIILVSYNLLIFINKIWCRCRMSKCLSKQKSKGRLLLSTQHFFF